MTVDEVVPGTVTIDPNVLEAIARLTAQKVPGVLRLAEKNDVEKLLGLGDKSIEVEVREDGAVAVEVHIIAAPNLSLLHLGRDVQQAVTRAIQQIVGMQVLEVNVYIEDVDFSAEESDSPAEG